MSLPRVFPVAPTRVFAPVRDASFFPQAVLMERAEGEVPIAANEKGSKTEAPAANGPIWKESPLSAVVEADAADQMSVITWIPLSQIDRGEAVDLPSVRIAKDSVPSSFQVQPDRSPSPAVPIAPASEARNGLRRELPASVDEPQVGAGLAEEPATNRPSSIARGHLPPLHRTSHGMAEYSPLQEGSRDWTATTTIAPAPGADVVEEERQHGLAGLSGDAQMKLDGFVQRAVGGLPASSGKPHATDMVTLQPENWAKSGLEPPSEIVRSEPRRHAGSAVTTTFAAQDQTAERDPAAGISVDHKLGRAQSNPSTASSPTNSVPDFRPAPPLGGLNSRLPNASDTVATTKALPDLGTGVQLTRPAAPSSQPDQAEPLVATANSSDGPEKMPSSGPADSHPVFAIPPAEGRGFPGLAEKPNASRLSTPVSTAGRSAASHVALPLLGVSSEPYNRSLKTPDPSMPPRAKLRAAPQPIPTPATPLPAPTSTAGLVNSLGPATTVVSAQRHDRLPVLSGRAAAEAMQVVIPSTVSQLPTQNWAVAAPDARLAKPPSSAETPVADAAAIPPTASRIGISTSAIDPTDDLVPDPKIMPSVPPVIRSSSGMVWQTGTSTADSDSGAGRPSEQDIKAPESRVPVQRSLPRQSDPVPGAPDLRSAGEGTAFSPGALQRDLAQTGSLQHLGTEPNVPSVPSEAPHAVARLDVQPPRPEPSRLGPRQERRESPRAELSAAVPFATSSTQSETGGADRLLPAVRPLTGFARVDVPLAGRDVEGERERDPLAPVESPSAARRDGGVSALGAPARTEMAQRIVRQIAEATAPVPDRPIQLTLDPEELGRVRLTFHSTDGALAVAIHADRIETLDLMRRHIDTLAGEYRAMGYRDVSFSFGQHGHSGGQSGSQPQHAGLLAQSVADAPAPAPHAASQPGWVSGRGGLDIRL